MHGPPTASPSRARWRAAALATVMLAAVASIAAVGVREERMDGMRARDELGYEAQLLAAVFASELRAALAGIEPPAGAGRPAGVELDGPRWRFTFPSAGDEPPHRVHLDPQTALHGHRSLHDGNHRLLLSTSLIPAELRDASGARIDLPALAEAVARGESWVQLTPAQATALALAPAVAVAGLARVDCGHFGEWTVIVVSSVAQQRAREMRRSIRLVVGVGLASLTLLAFGLALLRTQRQEQQLERELAREALRRQREEQLAREGRAATVLTFAAGMAHELSTPLGVIAMRAEQLETGAEDERSLRAARVIGEQVARIRDQVRRFLTLARGATPQRERFPALDVLRGAAERVQHRFERAGVRLDVQSGDALPWIRGDARLLEHCLTNLLLNACDASPPGSAVDLVASREGHELTIVVRDRGAGIDPAQRSRLGEPFFSAKPEGTGLGLALAREVVRMHRGALSLDPHPEGGTRAVLRFPVDPEVADDVSPGQAPDPRPPGR